MIKLLYAAFLGLMLALFIGYGVSVFYTAPDAPEYPEELISDSAQCINKTDGTGVSSRVCTTTTDIEVKKKAIQKQYDKDYEAFTKAETSYHRNVALVIVSLSVALLGIGVWMDKKLPVIGDGFLLGGV